MMPKDDYIHMRIDAEIKTLSEEILGRLGMTLPVAVTVFLHQVVLTNGLPFPITLPSPNENNASIAKNLDNVVVDSKDSLR